jgi:hypothetical protein
MQQCGMLSLSRQCVDDLSAPYLRCNKRREGIAVHGYTTNKDDVLKRLRRVEGR